MTEKHKQAYTISCSSAFRDAVEALATKRKVNAADIARSTLLLLPLEAIAKYPDPGEPSPKDRETVILKTGEAMGRPWRRKPRLQLRLPPGLDAVVVRKALNLALAMDRGELNLKLDDGSIPANFQAILEEQRDEQERLRAIINVLCFDPLHEGVQTREDALHVLGFHPGSRPSSQTIRARFRLLATIHHPDGAHGSHERMSQLNSAVALLRKLDGR